MPSHGLQPGYSPSRDPLWSGPDSRRRGIGGMRRKSAAMPGVGAVDGGADGCAGCSGVPGGQSRRAGTVAVCFTRLSAPCTLSLRRRKVEQEGAGAMVAGDSTEEQGEGAVVACARRPGGCGGRLGNK